MQMNTLNTIASGIIGLSHWSYMKPIDCNNAARVHIPGVEMTVCESIDLFNPI